MGWIKACRLPQSDDRRRFAKNLKVQLINIGEILLDSFKHQALPLPAAAKQ